MKTTKIDGYRNMILFGAFALVGLVGLFAALASSSDQAQFIYGAFAVQLGGGYGALMAAKRGEYRARAESVGKASGDQ